MITPRIATALLAAHLLPPMGGMGYAIRHDNLPDDGHFKGQSRCRIGTDKDRQGVYKRMLRRRAKKGYA